MPSGGLLLLLTGLLGAYAAAAAGSERRHLRDLWRKLALRPGAKLMSKDGPLSLEAGDASVEVDALKGMTEVRGRYPLPVGPCFVLHPKGEMGVEVMRHGAHPPLDIGLGRLDDVFMLRTSEPELCQRLFSPRFAIAFADRFSDASIIGERSQVRLLIPRLLADLLLIDAAIDLAAGLANADLFGLAALRALRGARQLERLAVQVDVGGTLVHYVPVVTTDGAATHAWVDVDDGPVLATELPCPDLDGFLAALPAPLSPDAVALLGRLGRAALAATGSRIELRFEAVERDPGRLVAAGSLLRALASPAGHGPYR